MAQRFFRASAVALDWPPHKIVPMPALSPTMETGNIAKWLKNEGDEIVAGDAVAEVETDKAVMEFEYGDDGFMAKILTKEGATGVPVGQPLCVVVEDQANVSAFANFTATDGGATADATASTSADKPAAMAAEQSATAPAQTGPASTQKQTEEDQGQQATPMAKKLAKEKGMDISRIPGTGPNGRVVEADIYSFEKSSAEQRQSASPATKSVPAAGVADHPVSGDQGSWASRLLHAKQTVPHYYLTVDIHLDPILALCKELSTEEEPLDATPFLLKACTLASLAVPACNSSWMGSTIQEYSHVDLALCLSGPAGVATPVLENAESMGLKALAANLKTLSDQVDAGNDVVSGPGTILVHPLGVSQPAMRNSAAIVMPPNSCSLTLGHPLKRVLPGPDGTPTTISALQATLSCDHRVVDGAVGADWCKVFKSLCEEPMRLLL